MKKILLGLGAAGVLGLAAFWIMAESATTPVSAPVETETAETPAVMPAPAAEPSAPPVAVAELPPVTAPASPSSAPASQPPAPVAPPPVAAVPAAPAAPVSNMGLPPGPNRELVVQSCGNCHDIGTFSGQRHTREEWSSIMQAMTARGLSLSDDEWTKIEDYLATALGR